VLTSVEKVREVNQCLDDTCYMAENHITVAHLYVHVHGLFTRNYLRHNMKYSRFAAHFVNRP
jgi:hypothetical protein